MEQQSISSDLIRGHIDTIILHTLLDGDKFAEQISETIEKKSGNAYKINQATLYSALKRLQNIKLLNAYQQDIENGGGRRKFFTLTDKGRETVEQNLSSWSYSRAIIDKLIDCEQKPVYKTEYVEKIVQIPVEKVVYKEVPIQNKVDIISPIEPPAQKIVQQVPSMENPSPKQHDSIQEVNFRNIINGLIESCNLSKKVENAVEIGAINREDIGETEDVQKLHETITENASTSKRQELETIDFSDLILKASKEGYKLRVSSKNSSKNNGNLLINKLNLLTALSMFLLVLIEMLVISFGYGDLIGMNLTVTLGLVVLALIYPVISIIKYVRNRSLTTSKMVYKDTILTCAIVVFNLLLINFAAILIFGLDFTIKKDVLLFLIIPIILYVDIIVCSILRYNFARNKLCLISKK